MFDSFLIFTYGGPEGAEEIDPFLENVAHGKNIPVERLKNVREHYARFDGKSPLNPYTRKFIGKLGEVLDLPIYHACRYSRPGAEDAMEELRLDGRRDVLVFTPDPFGCYRGPYVEKLEELRKFCGPEFPRYTFFPPFYDRDGFLNANVTAISRALESWNPERKNRANFVFTLHSLPVRAAKETSYDSMAEECVQKLGEKLVQKSMAGPTFLAWQSASASREPWLAPGLEEILRKIAENGGSRDAVIVPVGFPFENMEISYDLDVEAAALCAALGLTFTCVPTVGLEPEFLEMVANFAPLFPSRPE